MRLIVFLSIEEMHNMNKTILIFAIILSNSLVTFAQTGITMLEINTLKQYAAYNLWANEQYINWLKTGTEAQVKQEINSSFNSIEQTVAHLWNAEHGWLNAIEEKDWGEAPSKDYQGNWESFLNDFLATSTAFNDYVRTMDAEAFSKTINIGKKEYPSTKAQIVLHVFNHATYHRGQLITMGRQAGLSLPPPRADFIYYIQLSE